MIFNPTLFQDQVVLITGGSRGGMLKECAKEYLRHGAKAVVLMSRNKAKNDAVCQSLATFGQCISMPGDVSKIQDCQRVVSEVVSTLG